VKEFSRTNKSRLVVLVLIWKNSYGWCLITHLTNYTKDLTWSMPQLLFFKR